ncbi:uncharacterized protein LOC132548260 [Ylistrum balloti]|uniref:uncharacterized protein LOC132548260 n=1 Tax=Ylistrum balloti TaxID=509963 RepID=UPI0029058C2E|nr:uncharacterized protein LOC132548260 [Ylistrum balloti]
MSVDDTLKWFPIIVLLFIAHSRLVNNVAQAKTKELTNVNDYDAKNDYDEYFELVSLPERRKRSPSGNLSLDDEGFKRVSENIRKQHSRRRKKHRKSRKRKITDDIEREKKLSQALETGKEFGFRGDAVGNPCVTSPCAHGGICTWKRNEQPSFRCDCKIGFQGKRCEREIEECESLPCKEHGECVATPKGFLCLCKDGFGGKFCEIIQKTHTIVTEFRSPGSSDGIVLSTDTLNKVYVTVGVVGSLLGVIAISLCVHCCRVWNKRLESVQECRNIIENGGSISELPPDICDISESLCREFWCCNCYDFQGQKNQYEELLTEFRNSTQNVTADSPYQNMRLAQSEGALPHVRQGSYMSFRSLPAQMKSFTKRPSWLPDAEIANATDSEEFVQSPLSSRTRQTIPSSHEKYLENSQGLPMQKSHEGTDSEASLEFTESINDHLQRHMTSSREASPRRNSSFSQTFHHPFNEHNPSSQPASSSSTQHPPQSVFTRRASVGNILAHLSQTHPPLPSLPSEQSRSSSTFS